MGDDMPLYVYKCERCDSQRSDIRTIAERNIGPSCDHCGLTMKLQVSAVPGFVKNPAVPRGGK